MANLARIYAALLALSACSVESSVIEKAVMGATFDCAASHDRQQRALATLRSKLGTGKPLALRCDVADCSYGVAQGEAFGGKSVVLVAPSGLGVGWYNAQRPPSGQQKKWFKDGLESVSECKLHDRSGW